MAVQTNLGVAARTGYVLTGLTMMAWGFLGVEANWARYGLPIAGAVLVVEGLIGY